MIEITEEIEGNAFYSIVTSVTDVLHLNFGMVEELLDLMWTDYDLQYFLFNPALGIYEWIKAFKEFKEFASFNLGN